MLNGFMNIPVPGDTTVIEKEHKEWSMEAMTEEIKDMENFENYFATESAAIGDASVAQSEYLNMVADFRAIEGMEAKDAESFLKERGYEVQFALEAAKDVLARQAYMGSAKVKAIIKTIIAAIQKLITISATTNKAFKTVKKMAEKRIKSIKGKMGSKKVSGDKFIRELYPLLPKTLTDSMSSSDKKGIENISTTEISQIAGNILTVAGAALSEVGLTLNLPNASNMKELTDFFSEGFQDKLSDLRAEAKSNIDDLKDALNEKDEFEKSELVTAVLHRLEGVKHYAGIISKDKTLKALEKIQKELNKLLSSNNLKRLFPEGKNDQMGGMDVALFTTMINGIVSIVALVESNYKNVAKTILQWADNVLTDGAAVESMM